MATLTVTETHAYTSDVLVNITDITFNTSALFQAASFDAAQFDNVQISQTVHITGDSNSDQFSVIMTAPGTFSAAGWTFTNWQSGNFVILQGSDGADTITGSTQSNTFFGGDGADTMTGGSNSDIFSYFAGTDVEAGESINGLGGTDSIQVLSTDTGNSYDFSLATVSGVEKLLMNLGPVGGGSSTVTLAGDQIGLGGITSISSGSSTSAVIVVGSLVDLSPVTFNNWTDGVDTLTITGTAGEDDLVGSTKADRIKGGGDADSMDGGNGNDVLTGGRGKDTLAGGVDADRDIFDFNLKSESKTGALRDVITDFTDGVDDIDVAGIDAKGGVNGNQTFHWIGKHLFHHAKGELHYKLVNNAGTANDKTIVSGDINGDGKADFQIEMTGLHNLHKGDFIL